LISTIFKYKIININFQLFKLKDFDWSPKEQQDLVKTASTESQAQKSDKDILYAAAKKAVAAQMELDVIEKQEEPPCDKVVPTAKDVAEIKTELNPSEKSDAVKIVQELADKAEKAEQVAEKVEEAVDKAVAKVEEAAQEIKDAVNAEEKAADEVILEVEVEEEEKEETEEKEEKAEKKEDEEKEEKVEKKEDEIIQESCMAASKEIAMKSAAADVDDFVKTSKISPTTRKKITAFWKDMLGYDANYVKLMATDFEK
jgi:hypothetical protein